VGVSINGNNITITGFTLEIINGANTESGVAYIIITPDGGVGSLPFMATGLPGSPTLFPTINMVQLPDGTALPSLATVIAQPRLLRRLKTQLTQGIWRR
jgi:hypothetical protein